MACLRCLLKIMAKLGLWMGYEVQTFGRLFGVWVWLGCGGLATAWGMVGVELGKKARRSLGGDGRADAGVGLKNSRSN
jgi:hypothetical protein